MYPSFKNNHAPNQRDAGHNGVALVFSVANSTTSECNFCYDIFLFYPIGFSASNLYSEPNADGAKS